MARVETDKKINPTQLGIELGRVPLRVVAGAFVESDAVTQADLEAAVGGHVADDGYVDPQYVPEPDPQDDLEARIQAVHDTAPAGPAKDLAAALLGLDGGDSQVAARHRDDAA